MRRNKSKNIIMIIALIICLFTTSTIAYSAISSTMNIKGTAKARIETNVRITNFKLYTINDATSYYESFHKNGILSSVSLPNASSYIIYEIEISNYGNTDVGIYSINGIPAGLTYEITNYNLKDKICDNSGVCSLGIKKSIYLKIQKTNTATDFSLNLEFDFKKFHKITYENVIGTNLPTEIISTDPLSISLESYPKYVDITMGSELLGQNDYKYENGKIDISSVTNDIHISKSTLIEQYQYTGNYQIFTAPTSGVYKIELWGASGGYSYLQNDDIARGGYGGYTRGEIALSSGEKLYIYVGGVGVTCECHSSKTCCGENGGYNGGGNTYQYTGHSTWYGSGGGATDVRYFEKTPTEEQLIWNSTLGLNSRIMVSGGGAGASNWQGAASSGYNFLGGSSGGLESSISIPLRNDRDNVCYPATQTAPGTGTYNELSSFGQGGTPTGLYGPGGGGGYYGGGASETYSSGGSSYISGHTGCVAISSKSAQTPKTGCQTGSNDKNCSIHYTNLIFENTKIIDGLSYEWTNKKQSQIQMPNPIKGTYASGRGHKGNGYAKVYLLNQNITEYNITYDGLKGTYPQKIISGRTLTLDLTSENLEDLYILINNQETSNYTYENKILTIPNVTGNITIKTIYSKYINNLESYYPLSSSLNDESTTKRFGDLITQETVTILYEDNSLVVNGTGLRSKTNTNTFPDQFTIMIDFYPKSTDSNWHHIWGIWNGINTPTSYNSLSHFSNDFQIQNGQEKGETTNSPMKLNQWHRLIVINDSTKWDLYLDGNFIVSASSTTDKKTGYLYVGKNISSEGVFSEPSIVGNIKNLRIYNTPFTKEEIKLLGTTK